MSVGVISLNNRSKILSTSKFQPFINGHYMCTLAMLFLRQNQLKHNNDVQDNITIRNHAW